MYRCVQASTRLYAITPKMDNQTKLTELLKQEQPLQTERKNTTLYWDFSDDDKAQAKGDIYRIASLACEWKLAQPEVCEQILNWCEAATSATFPLNEKDVRRQVEVAYQLNTKIEVSSVEEINQVAELDRAYKVKVRALMDYFGLNYRDDRDQAHQLWRLVIELAKREFPGFQLSLEGRAQNKKTDGPPGWKLYCVVQNAMKETGWSQNKVLKTLFSVRSQEEIDTMSLDDLYKYELPPRCLTYYPEFSYPTFNTASALKRRYFEVQEDLKARFESRTNKHDGATFEDFINSLMVQLKWAPEFFEQENIERSYKRLAIFTKL